MGFSKKGSRFVASARDFFKWYRAEKKYQKKEALTRDQYLKLEALYIEFIQNRIIEEQLIYVFPEKLGKLYIKAYHSPIFKSGVRYRFKDNSVTKDRLRYHNAHTFGYYFKFHWPKGGAYLLHKAWYGFFPASGDETGQGKRRLSKFLFQQNEDPHTLVIRK